MSKRTVNFLLFLPALVLLVFAGITALAIVWTLVQPDVVTTTQVVQVSHSRDAAWGLATLLFIAFVGVALAIWAAVMIHDEIAKTDHPNDTSQRWYVPD